MAKKKSLTNGINPKFTGKNNESDGFVSDDDGVDIPITSCWVHNEVTEIDVKKLHSRITVIEQLIKKGKKGSIFLFQVTQGGKKILLVIAGGKVDVNEKDFSLTGMGELAVNIGLKYASEMIVQAIHCDCSSERLGIKIRKWVSKVPEGCLLALVGDMVGTCDGKILQHLNLTKETITREFVKQ